VQQQRDHKVQAWCQFAERQAKRYVRPPPSSSSQRRLLPEPTCYRLRIGSISNLPQLLARTNGGSSSSSSNFELRLGVSLYDEAAGACYGNTCYSQADVPKQQQQQQHDDASCDFCFDVFFHSVISDPRCMAVVSSCWQNFTHACNCRLHNCAAVLSGAGQQHISTRATS
jgi:nephrocystin-4